MLLGAYDNLEHSIWLTMMRDRLLHLRSLLSKEGSIWVHLDSGEIHRMRSLMDEVFGPERFISEISWEKTFKPRNDAGYFSSRHDTILVYAKTEAFRPKRLPRSASMDNGYANPDSDSKGYWTSAPATAPDAKGHQGMVYAIQHPMTGELMYPSKGRCWNFGQQDMLDIMKQWNPKYELQDIGDEEKRADICNVAAGDVRAEIQAIVIPDFSKEDKEHDMTVYKQGNWPVLYITNKGKGGFRKKTYLCDAKERVPEDVWFFDEVGSNDDAKNEIKKLFPGRTAFDTPKPERLLQQIIHISTNPGDIVLDCFAGSGTTAAVAQKMGRRWITCELLEENFNNYTKPRLTKVVNDEDPGGITETAGVRIAGENVDLPEKVTPEDAAKFTSVLNYLIGENDSLKNDATIKKLKSLAKTQNAKPTVNWRGGGGFQVAHLSPECFTYSRKQNRVLLTEAAHGDTLVRSVAANLGFIYIAGTPGTIFDGRCGKTFLKVIEGVADTKTVDWLLSQIAPEENITIATTSLVDGVRQYLRKKCKGAKIVVIPDDIFPYSKEAKD